MVKKSIFPLNDTTRWILILLVLTTASAISIILITKHNELGLQHASIKEVFYAIFYFVVGTLGFYSLTSFAYNSRKKGNIFEFLILSLLAISSVISTFVIEIYFSVHYVEFAILSVSILVCFAVRSLIGKETIIC